MEHAPKKVFVKTYGCQMNVYDSERMRDVLGPLGYAETAVPEQADLVILNTCHIREKAAEKVYSELGKIRRMKRERAERGELLFGNIDTWLAWNLTGGPDGGLHVTDVTNASRTQMMDLHSLDWDDGILAEFGVPRACLPRICSSSEVYVFFFFDYRLK